MNKALEIGKVSAGGTVYLFAGKTLSTIILAVGTIVLAWFILEGDYGLYAVALIPVGTLSLFQDWGVSTALTRSCAKYRAANEAAELRKTVMAGLTFEVATGTILAAASALTATFVATIIFKKPETAPLIMLASLSILSASVLSATQSIFVGFERMKLSSLTMISQAMVQTSLATSLVYLGYGAIGAMIGYTIASLVASVFSIILLKYSILRNLPKVKTSKSQLIPTIKSLLNYGVPLAIASIVSGVLIQFYLFMMASYCTNEQIGDYKVSGNFGLLLTLITVPVSTVLFPAFSKIDAQKEKHLLRTVFASSVKYLSLLLVPATLMMIVLSSPLIGTLYGDKWLYAPLYLSFGIVGNLFVIIGNLGIGSLFAALAETKLLLKLSLVNIVVGVPIGFLLIPSFGIMGLIIGSLVAGLPGMFIGVWVAWKRYKTKVNFRISLKILLSSGLAFIATLLLLHIFSLPYWIQLLAGVVTFLVVYLLSAPLIGAINQKDIRNMRTMFSDIGIISKILEIPLIFEERILRFLHRKDNMMESETDTHIASEFD
jgi:O-antigen/teichoic acid export membrane protein